MSRSRSDQDGCIVRGALRQIRNVSRDGVPWTSIGTVFHEASRFFFEGMMGGRGISFGTTDCIFAFCCGASGPPTRASRQDKTIPSLQKHGEDYHCSTNMSSMIITHQDHHMMNTGWPLFRILVHHSAVAVSTCRPPTWRCIFPAPIPSFLS